MRHPRSALRSAPRPAHRSALPRRSREIFDAAAEVFAERGYRGASTQDIADRLGLRQASLYHYFSSKEAALERVCAIGVEGFYEGLERIAAARASAREKLRGAIENHMRPAAERQAYVRVFLRDRRELPGAAGARIRRMARRYERLFEAVLREGVARGEFRADLDTRITALGIIGMCNAAVAWFGREPKADLARIVGAFAAMALQGCARGGGAIGVRVRASAGTRVRARSATGAESGLGRAGAR